MPWFTIILDIMKALFTGDFKRLWAEYKEKEADDAKNKANALSDTAATDELRSKWTR